MSETIIVALISFLGSAVASFSGFRLAVYRIEQLEKKVHEHNQLVARTYKLEQEIALIEQKIEHDH